MQYEDMSADFKKCICMLSEKKRSKHDKIIKSALCGSNLRRIMPLHLSSVGDGIGDTGSSIVSTISILALGVKTRSTTNQSN